MDFIKDLFVIIGGILGTIAFFWKVWDILVSHLQIDLEIESTQSKSKNQVATALAIIENQGFTPKGIDYAFLLIGPEGVNSNEMAANIIKSVGIDVSIPDQFDCLQKLLALRPEQPVYTKDKCYGLIPLTFFFQEQKLIGNEKVKYRCMINVDKLEKHKSYSVIFFILTRYSLGIMRGRATSDLLRVD